MRAHGTSEVIAALRSLDRKDGLEFFYPRKVEPASRSDGTISLINDFGPQLGSPATHSLVTHKRSFTVYECVDGAQSLFLSGSRRFDLVLWAHSAEADVELDPIASMLEAACFLGARRAMVFVTDAHRVSAQRRDVIEQEARQLLELADLTADESVVLFASGPIERGADESWKPAVRQLRDALDEQAPYVEIESRFALRVEDVFSLKSRGVLATGPVLEGTVRVGDTLELLSINGRRAITVKGIEMIRRSVESARRGDNVGLFLSVASRDELARDDLLVSPGAGRLGRILRARAFNWVGARAPTRASVVLRGAASPRIAVRRISVDPRPDGPSSYELELELQTPLPMVESTSFILGDERSAVGVGYLDEVLE